LIKSQTFNPDWPELCYIRDDRAQTWRKYGFQEPRVVLHSFYVKIPLIKLVLLQFGKFE